MLASMSEAEDLGGDFPPMIGQGDALLAHDVIQARFLAVIPRSRKREEAISMSRLAQRDWVAPLAMTCFGCLDFPGAGRWHYLVRFYMLLGLPTYSRNLPQIPRGDPHDRHRHRRRRPHSGRRVQRRAR